MHTEIEHLNDLRLLSEKTIYHCCLSIRCDRISYVNMTQYPDRICPIIGKVRTKLNYSILGASYSHRQKIKQTRNHYKNNEKGKIESVLDIFLFTLNIVTFWWHTRKKEIHSNNDLQFKVFAQCIEKGRQQEKNVTKLTTFISILFLLSKGPTN